MGGGGSMTWPNAVGIAVYGGSSAWGTSIAETDGDIVAGVAGSWTDSVCILLREAGRVQKHQRRFSAMTQDLQELAEWLRQFGVTLACQGSALCCQRSMPNYRDLCSRW
jgi:hypothetical protein